jgi:hypothetical protein
MVGLPGYFLGKQVVHVAMLLPVIQFSKSNRRVEDSNPKSIKSSEIVGKVYNFKNAQIF